jgi:signal transduction histidine kinase
MSHELRTPLNAIIGLTEMMVSNAPRFGTEKALEPLRRVNAAGTYLLSLINEVLRPDCRPRRKQAAARLATHRPRSGGALLELRRQPKAALPARANWTNIFGRLDLMVK